MTDEAFPYVAARRGVLHSALSSNEKLVLVALVERANPAGTCWPSFARVALDTSMCRSTAHKTMRALRDRGLLSWTARRRDGAREMESNLYRLDGAALSALPDAAGEVVRETDHLARLTDGGSPADGRGVVRVMDGGSPPDAQEVDHGRRPSEEDQGRSASAEPPKPAVPVSRKVKAPKDDVNLSELCPRGLSAHAALVDDPSLWPIISKPVETARDLAKVAAAGIDVAIEVRKAGSWLRANPGRAGKKNGAKFLLNWIGRATPMLPGVSRPGRPGVQPMAPIRPEWMDET